MLSFTTAVDSIFLYKKDIPSLSQVRFQSWISHPAGHNLPRLLHTELPSADTGLPESLMPNGAAG